MDEERVAEFEQGRLERVAKLDEHHREDDPDRQRSYARSPCSIHEALHMAHVFGDMVDRHLGAHPAVVPHPQLYDLANQPGYALAEQYRAIGNIVPDEEGGVAANSRSPFPAGPCSG